MSRTNHTDHADLKLTTTNSTTLLFSSLTLYNLRLLERLWGTRKLVSFLFSTALYTTLLPPFFLALILRPLTLYYFNTLPAGPTSLLFALLAQYHAAIPHVYKYRIATSSTSAPTVTGITLTDKSTVYLLSLQLALSQLPGSLLQAGVGWLVGYAWRSEILPGGATRWRVPMWLVGRGSAKYDGRYEGLRRRLQAEGESGSGGARTTGSDGRDGPEVTQETVRRRGVSGLIREYLPGWS